MLLFSPVLVVMFLLGLLLLAIAEIEAKLRGHETDPTLTCGCVRCMQNRKRAG
jgi:hypothetical protein